MSSPGFSSSTVSFHARKWDSEKVYFDGDSFFGDLIQAIEQAKSSITVESYIFTKDEFTAKIESILAAAAARGVSVRMVVDGIGASTWIGRWDKNLFSAGVLLRIYHPLIWSTLFSLRRFLRLHRFISNMNRRNHRKVWIIDDKTAWVGSMNITGVHLESYFGSNAWRDTGIRVEGSEVQLLTEAFENVWARSHTPEGKRRWLERFKPRRDFREALVRLNFNRKLRRQSTRDFLRRLKTAQQRIWITNPYFVPSTMLLATLVRAQRRGVDVKLLVPQQSDVFFMKWVATSFYSPLLQNGIKVYEYLPRILHAKSVLIDNWATVGTSNMNTRSILHDLEVDIVVTHDESKNALEKRFLQDLESSEEVRHATMGRSRIWASYLGRIVTFLARNWI